LITSIIFITLAITDADAITPFSSLISRFQLIAFHYFIFHFLISLSPLRLSFDA